MDGSGALPLPVSNHWCVLLTAETVENYDIVHPHIIDAESFRPHPKLLVLEICRREANFTLKLEMNE